MAYTYDDFMREYQGSGLPFSEQDLNIAKSNPNAGMQLLQFKKDYMGATTDEARTLANSNAENVRKQYGYTGGSTGMGYNPTQTNSQSSFPNTNLPTIQYPTAPSSNPSDYKPMTTPYTNDVNNMYSNLLNYPTTPTITATKPNYTSKYDSLIDQKMSDISNKQFEYDPATDPNTKYYEQAYRREGDRATQNALGAASALTGGLPSSYAVSAATQAGNYYAAQLADKYPDLYNSAYNRFMNEMSNMRSNVDMYMNAENMQYGRYQDQLGQYNQDRNFEYSTWLDQNTMMRNNLATAQGLSTDYVNQSTAAQQNEYSRYIDQWNMAEQQDQTQYGRQQDTLNRQRQAEQDKQSQSVTGYNQQYEMAVTAAEYGDFSKLEALGIDTTYARQLYQQAVNSATSTGTGAGSTMTETQVADSLMAGTWNDTLSQSLYNMGATNYEINKYQTAYKAFMNNDFSANVVNKVLELLNMFMDVSQEDLKNLNPNYGVTNSPANYSPPSLRRDSMATRLQ